MTAQPKILCIGIKGILMAINPETGDEVWRHRVGGSGFVSILVQGEVVYAAVHRELHCVHHTSGQLVWSQTLGQGVIGAAGGFVTFHVEGQSLHVGAHGELFSFNRSTGQLHWHNKLPGLGFGLVTFESTPPLAAAAELAAESGELEV